ncbi:hypothetical protein LTR36_010789 [Oleoguttula mirabilis]|uniref:Rhomboid family protein n=1 Tax=Oleoguttula mirabilis TaxID=1507867 RepID=A0AAV9JR06_9PEZI|nr:hypothetical protein LTR36_010789 [Oleoguttula mirabilis]
MPPRITLPPLTRALLLTLLALSALNAVLRTRKWTASLPSTPTSPNSLAATAANYLSSPSYAIPYLALIPTQSIRYPWTFLTAALVENNVVSLAVSGSVIWFGGRYLERAWGSTEFGKFVLFVTMIPNLLSFGVYAFWHGVAGTPEFPTPIQGLLALSAAFLVALKQLVPEHTVSLLRGALRIRIKHFPALFTLANMVSGPLLGTDTALWLSLFGFLTGWIYLRFFRVSELTSSTATGGEGAVTIRGDASDTFAFVAFFPDAMHGFLAPVCDAVYGALVQLRVCTPFSPHDVETGSGSAASRSEGLPSIVTGGGGGGRTAEAERRRAVALQALDQRLNAAAAASTSAAGAPVSMDRPTVTGEAARPGGETQA